MDAWPWIAVAGLGALHGLSPAGGWVFVTARPAGRALLPLAGGHLAAVAVTALAIAQGWAPDRDAARGLAAVLLLAVAWRQWRAPEGRHPCGRPGDVALAGWSFLIGTAHGSGLVLVPALVPLCLSDGPARAITASGSLLLAMLAVAVHLAAMLATTGVVAAGAGRLSWAHTGTGSRRAGVALLALAGAALLLRV